MGELRSVLEEARGLGFLGPGEVVPHIDHARGFAEAAGGAPNGRLLDLGSGGGVPGLVLALDWPAVGCTLVDSNARRARFLEEAIATLGLTPRVEVVHGRAEVIGRDLAHRAQYALVTARAFAPPAPTAECAAPFLQLGGTLIVSEPPHAAPRWPALGLALLGLSPVAQVRSRAGYQVLHQGSTCPERFPRRVGVPVRRPLF